MESGGWSAVRGVGRYKTWKIAMRRRLAHLALATILRRANRARCGCSGDYHDRLKLVRPDLSLEPKLTSFACYEPLLDRFVPFHEGLLEKKSPKKIAGKAVWQKRWFVLKNCSLYYYKSQKDMQAGEQASGVISLEQIKVSFTPRHAMAWFTSLRYRPASKLTWCSRRSSASRARPRSRCLSGAGRPRCG